MGGASEDHVKNLIAMNDQLIQLLQNYKDGVPVKIERSSLVALAATSILVVAISAGIVKIIKNL